MSYGQPWSRMTTGPFAGPVSAYPTFRTPASICLSESKVSLDGACMTRSLGALEKIVVPNRAVTSPVTALPRNWRRSLLISSVMLSPQRLERSAQLGRKQFRLLPRREVPAFRDFVVVD